MRNQRTRREVCIPLEFTVNGSIAAGVSGGEAGGGQGFLRPWGPGEAKSLWAAAGAAVTLGMVKWTGCICWIEQMWVVFTHRSYFQKM